MRGSCGSVSPRPGGALCNWGATRTKGWEGDARRVRLPCGGRTLTKTRHSDETCAHIDSRVPLPDKVRGVLVRNCSLKATKVDCGNLENLKQRTNGSLKGRLVKIRKKNHLVAKFECVCVYLCFSGEM